MDEQHIFYMNGEGMTALPASLTAIIVNSQHASTHIWWN
jgi:hypothetical protein